MTPQVDDLSIFGADTYERVGRADRRRQQKRNRRRRRRRVAGPLIALIVVAGLAGGVFVGGRTLLDRFSPTTADYAGEGSGRVTVEVQRGETATDIAATLVKAGVVKSERAFRDAAKDDPRSLSIQPGVYRLRKQMSGTAALVLLLDPKARLQARFTVPEGLSVAATLQLISEKTRLPLRDLRAAAKNTAALGLPSYARGRLEGFLFPATYEVDPGTGAVEVLRRMVATYREQVDEAGLLAGAPAGYSPYQLLVVASLVEEETRRADERGKVARVVYNRLDRDFYLGIDAAILYGLGRSAGELTQADLDKPTPYNNRLVKGLPPTPITNPGIASITGAVQPADGDWLYYVLADRSGRHFFTADRDEFNDAAERCRQNGLC